MTVEPPSRQRWRCQADNSGCRAGAGGGAAVHAAMAVPSWQRRLQSGRWWRSRREGNDGGAEQATTAAKWANPMEGVEEESPKLME
ncbi:hypothetical protein Dimus_006282, partial [Dionaea muscipula]